MEEFTIHNFTGYSVHLQEEQVVSIIRFQETYSHANEKVWKWPDPTWPNPFLLRVTVFSLSNNEHGDKM